MRLSTTAFGEASTCLKKFEYHQIDKLVPRPDRMKPSVRLGIKVHYALELHHNGQPWIPGLDEMRDWDLAHGIDSIVADEMYNDAVDIVQGYITYWEENGGALKTISTEDQRIKPVRLEGGFEHELSATIDRIAEDKDGKWLVETKTTGDIPPASWRAIDPQTAMQYITATLTGVEVVGILFDYILTKKASVPRVKKDGELYANSGVTTTAAFRKCIPEIVEKMKARGVDPVAIKVYVVEKRDELVNDGAFYQRYKVFRPEDTLQETIKDIASTFRRIQDAEDHGHYQRSLNVFSCRRFCFYADLCHIEFLTGKPAEAVRESEYVIETPETRNYGRYAAPV